MALCPLMNSRCEKNYCAWYDYDKEQCSILVLAKSTYKLKKDKDLEELEKHLKGMRNQLELLKETIGQEE